MDRGTCSTCHKPILWGRTKKGAAIPLDPDPVPDGNLFIEDGVVHYVTKGMMFSQPQTRYVTHFSTCVSASQHRKAK